MINSKDYEFKGPVRVKYEFTRTVINANGVLDVILADTESGWLPVDDLQLIRWLSVFVSIARAPGQETAPANGFEYLTAASLSVHAASPKPAGRVDHAPLLIAQADPWLRRPSTLGLIGEDPGTASLAFSAASFASDYYFGRSWGDGVFTPASSQSLLLTEIRASALPGSSFDIVVNVDAVIEAVCDWPE